MQVFDHPEFHDHERVLYCSNRAAGLRAIIAVHDRGVGPAAGGCRMFDYANPADALVDVLRLSRGMTFKNALAGLPLGGGKAVILADPRAPGKRERLAAFGDFVQTLGGDYWTAIDVGVGASDAQAIAERCQYVFALGEHARDRADTSYFTALGGFVAIRACLKQVFGSDELAGRRVAIQGCGATGSYLAEMLVASGARLVVADVHQVAAEAHRVRFDADVVPPESIYEQPADVFAPCALGAIVNDDTVARLRAPIVCGLANNQLAAPRHGDALAQRGILYAPDYAVNAGGIIYASDEIFGENDEARARRRIDAIADTLAAIFARSQTTGLGTHRVADALAGERLGARHRGLAPDAR